MKIYFLTLLIPFLLSSPKTLASIECQDTNREEFLKINENLYKEYSALDANQNVGNEKKAFWLKGNPNIDKAIVLIHGYMGSPGEMMFLAEPFIKEGWSIIGILIPGHGSTSAISNTYKFERWIKEVKTQLELVTNCFSEVRAVGFSTGGLLLHHYVLNNSIPPSLKSLHLVSPYFVQRFGKFIDRFLGFFINGMSVDAAYFISRFRDLKVMSVDRKNYHQNIPMETAFQVKELGLKVYHLKESKNEFSKITLPVQVFLTEGDWTVDTDATKKVMNRDYENVQLTWYEGREPHHLMAPSVSRVASEVQRLIFSFKESTLK